jgi:hypothetical protein
VTITCLKILLVQVPDAPKLTVHEINKPPSEAWSLDPSHPSRHES